MTASRLIEEAWWVINDDSLGYTSERERAADALYLLNSVIDQWNLELPLNEFFEKYVKPAFLPDL